MPCTPLDCLYALRITLLIPRRTLVWFFFGLICPCTVSMTIGSKCEWLAGPSFCYGWLPQCPQPACAASYIGLLVLCCLFCWKLTQFNGAEADGAGHKRKPTLEIGNVKKESKCKFKKIINVVPSACIISCALFESRDAWLNVK